MLSCGASDEFRMGSQELASAGASPRTRAAREGRRSVGVPGCSPEKVIRAVTALRINHQN
jgi:hypothetical protein